MRAWDGALRAQLSLLQVNNAEQFANVSANSVIEMQAFIVETVGKFEFTMTERSERVCRAPCSMMVPMVDGELEHGSQLPLAVSVAAREGDI